MESLIHWFIILHLQSSIFFDTFYAETQQTDTAYVSALQKGNVTFKIGNEVKQKRDITWVTDDGNHFATTKPEDFITIRDSRYRGRLYSLKDGSLLMTNVTMEDRGMYIASIRPVDGNIYAQKFNLSVTDSGSSRVMYNFLQVAAATQIWLVLS